ncbi:hypothetical protein AAEX28_13165 [Lentisphaerota bacterium WC36G]|nr:hypothetical protein LJT99_15995 [Lentisphaerae bacterium WC36]
MDKNNNQDMSPNGNLTNPTLEEMLKSLPPDLAHAAAKGLTQTIPEINKEEIAEESVPQENTKINSNTYNQEIKDEKNIDSIVDFEFSNSETVQDIFSEDKALENLQDHVVEMFQDKVVPSNNKKKEKKKKAKKEPSSETPASFKFNKKQKFDFVRFGIYLLTALVIFIMGFIYYKMSQKLSSQRSETDTGKVEYNIDIDTDQQHKIIKKREEKAQKIEDPIEKYKFFVKQGLNFKAVSLLTDLIKSKGNNRSEILKLFNKLPENQAENIRSALYVVNDSYDKKEPVILSLLAARETDAKRKADVLKSIFETSSGNEKAGNQLIKYYYDNNELEEALKTCEAIINYNSDVDFEIIVQKAELLVLLNREKEAVDLMVKMMQNRTEGNREEQLVTLLNIFILSKKSKMVDRYLRELSQVSDKKQLKKYYGYYRNSVYSSLDYKSTLKDDYQWDIYSKPFYVVSLIQSEEFDKLSMMPISKEKFPALWNIYANWKLNNTFWQENALKIAKKEVNKDKVEVLFAQLIIGQITIDDYLAKESFIAPTLTGKYYFLAGEYLADTDKEKARKYYVKSVKSRGNIYHGVAKAKLKKLK